MKKSLLFALAALLFVPPLAAQEGGSIEGVVRLTGGETIAGVVVEASSPVLPRPRVTATLDNGAYRLPGLPPGVYRVTFTLGDQPAEARDVQVFLDQTRRVDVTLGLETVEESIDVVAQSSLIDPSSAELKSAISEETVENLPVGQEYRDVLKLIPGVQYSEETVRGPSAGGSGQDNVYKFDGVNVGMPLFGVLSAEPSSHDIAEVAVIKGGAKATDFNRSGGFTVNTVSKAGTADFQGEVSYQIQTDSMTGDRDVESGADFENDRDWTVLSLGGPVLRDQLYFYTSYYRPTVTRDSRSNFYGDVPDFESVRNEFFGKLSWTPFESLLVSGSYRDSDREEEGASVTGEAQAASTSEGGEATLEIAILEGSWIVNPDSFVSFKYSDFANETASRPDLLFDFPIRGDGSVGLDLANLESQGLFNVPELLPGQDAYNDFVRPFIDRYGYLENGTRVGGGEVGGASTINDQDFFRESFQVGYDYLIDSRISHEIHVGYQWYTEEEDLARLSNGWGSITVPGGRVSTADGTPIFFQASFEQMSLVTDSGAVVPVIHSEYESQNIEINDTIRWNDWTFNVGVLASNDTLYGQGLDENSANLSGFEVSPGTQYEMYELDFGDMLQPRVGATWNYNGRDTVYASWARYHPSASSLPRAASWDRNLRQTIRAYFDAEGDLIGLDPVRSSSGKFFQDDLEPRAIDEYMLGTARQIDSRWTARANARYRYGYNFWEDTNNDARIRFNSPEGVPDELYIPDLNKVRDEIGGSSYVIAELDGAFTKYYEASLDADWRGDRAFVRGSYVWSHYYGNFDQDNTAAENDDAIFLGSSNLADGAGRQIWDNKYGDLRGDRRHQVKLYGYYLLPWNASTGAYAIYQSGQPWEAWDYRVYQPLTGTSTSDTNRYAEPAGSRRTPAHYQLDLNYTQRFPQLLGRVEAEIRADLFNAFDKQTGYNVDPRVNNPATFGEFRDFYEPRRFQLAVALRF